MIEFLFVLLLPLVAWAILGWQACAAGYVCLCLGIVVGFAMGRVEP